MSHTADAGYVAVESRFFHRIFWIFAILAGLSLVISVVGGEIGSRLSMGGHTDSSEVHEIVIGNDVLSVSSNRIRYPEQRRDGVAKSIDLYALWPTMEGFSEKERAAFNNVGQDKKLMFLSFEPRSLSRDMSGRFEPIYSKMITRQGETLANGLVRYALPESAGFVDETLMVGKRGDGSVFVARCLTEAKAATALAACDRDIHVGEDLMLMARFPAELLDDWKTLDLNLTAFADQTVRSIKP
ncbi:MAG: hypothetical protein WCC66_00090 [Rhizobiaceae bacterium]